MAVRARKRWALVAAAGLALPIILAGCSSSDDPTAADAAGSVNIFGCKPGAPLVPASTIEVCGGNIMDAVFTGLVTYDAETAEPQEAIASSIESDDNKTWTVELNDDYTFHDGTPVTASSFVDAWNWAAYAPNGQLNSYFFANIEGYGDLNPEDPDGDPETDNTPEPETDAMSGLTVVDDHEFTVTLTDPQSSFPVQLGYIAFAPLPTSFFASADAPKDFGRKPVGSGPFRVVDGTPDKGFTLEAYADYVGPDVPKVKTFAFKTYQSPQAAYADMRADNGKLDLMDQVPPSALADNRYQKDFPGRFVNKPVGLYQSLTLPLYVEDYADDPKLGQALSMAIDRETITQAVFNGGRTPADGWVSPVVEGYEAGACDPYCTFDPDAARAAFAEVDFKGPFSFSYNADGPGNKETAEAVCNSIKNVLEVECTANAFVNFETFREASIEREMPGMFRTGWQMDYPSMENFLAPLYVTNAAANDGEYSNPAFDELITRAAGESPEDSLGTYREAERLLAQDMAVIPLWHQAQQSVWSTRVSDVKVTPFSTFDLTSVTLTAEPDATSS